VDVTIAPATPDRWDDVVTVFGTRGDPARCWCTYLFGDRVDYSDRVRNQDHLRRIVAGPTPPGLLAYSGDTPVGWVAAAPRPLFGPRLARSPALKPLPYEGTVWSVLCFVVPRAHRGQGVAHALLAGAVDRARSGGAAAIEGVPRDDRTGKRWPNPVAYTGTASMFEAAGFTEIERRRDDRVVYRLLL
jgi:GNAT superfamily N-acetyltransferase